MSSFLATPVLDIARLMCCGGLRPLWPPSWASRYHASSHTHRSACHFKIAKLNVKDVGRSPSSGHQTELPVTKWSSKCGPKRTSGSSGQVLNSPRLPTGIRNLEKIEKVAIIFLRGGLTHAWGKWQSLRYPEQNQALGSLPKHSPNKWVSQGCSSSEFVLLGDVVYRRHTESV